MYRRTPFALDEWYHCYTRTIERERKAFNSPSEYHRFLDLLYLANDTKPVDRGALFMPRAELFRRSRAKTIVAIGGYCVMPNHFHLLLKEVGEGGITKFMRKLGTGYSMYFNLKNERIGNVFVKPFRSKHIENDRYLRHVLQYIHLNAASLFEPNFKFGRVKNLRELAQKMQTHAHSSFVDYLGHPRPERNILDEASVDLIKSDLPPIEESLKTAAAYRATLELKVP